MYYLVITLIIRNENQAIKFCCEDISKIYGYNDAVADKEKMWECHHCIGLVWTKEQLIEMGLYYNQPAERLMFVTRSQHKQLHYITGETQKKISESRKKWFINKKVIQFTVKGRIIKEWNSLNEIKCVKGFKITTILDCCKGKRKSAYDYIWKFKQV